MTVAKIKTATTYLGTGFKFYDIIVILVIILQILHLLHAVLLRLEVGGLVTKITALAELLEAVVAALTAAAGGADLNDRVIGGVLTSPGPGARPLCLFAPLTPVPSPPGVGSFAAGALTEGVRQQVLSPEVHDGVVKQNILSALKLALQLLGFAQIATELFANGSNF